MPRTNQPTTGEGARREEDLWEGHPKMKTPPTFHPHTLTNHTLHVICHPASPTSYCSLINKTLPVTISLTNQCVNVINVLQSPYIWLCDITIITMIAPNGHQSNPNLVTQHDCNNTAIGYAKPLAWHQLLCLFRKRKMRGAWGRAAKPAAEASRQ